MGKGEDGDTRNSGYKTPGGWGRLVLANRESHDWSGADRVPGASASPWFPLRGRGICAPGHSVGL